MSQRGRHRYLRRVLLTSTLGLACSPGLAQEAALPRLDPVIEPLSDQGVTMDVTRRYREEQEPLPLRIGSLDLLPTIAVRGGYESNIFGEERGAVDAAFVQVEPAAVLRSSSNSGEVRLEASGRFARFADNPEAKEDSYRAAAVGRYQTSRQLTLEGGSDIGQLVERRTSSGFPEGRVAPVRFIQSSAYGRAFYDSGRMRGFVSVDGTRFNFRDTRALDSEGRVIGRVDQDGRDYRVIRGSARVERLVGPAVGVFVQGIAASTRYVRDEVAPGVPNLDGSTYTALAGVAFQPGHLLQGSLGVGYVWRNYDAAAYRSIRGLAIEGELKYFWTPLVTVTAAASRTVEESVLQNRSSGILSTAGSVRIDYEMLRPLVVNAGVEYRYNEFRLLPRRDRITGAFAGARYAVGRHIALEGDLRYERRSVKNDPFAPTFDDVTAQIGLRYAL